MAYGDENDFGWCNLFIKFALFVMNFLLWVIGSALVAAGAYAQAESDTLSGFGLESVLVSPGIMLIILGSIMFILGFLGCLGALREIFILLVVYCVILGAIVAVEVGFGIWVYLSQERAEEAVTDGLSNAVVNYYNDPDLQSLIDYVQADLLLCCGINSPNDWQLNPYFNCSSVAFQRCSVPYTCCVPEEGMEEVINVQCGYRALDVTDPERLAMVDIYQDGCLTKAETFLNQYLYVIAGVGLGLLVFQLVNIILASGLAIDVRKEKKALRIYNQRAKQQKQLDRDLKRM